MIHATKKFKNHDVSLSGYLLKHFFIVFPYIACNAQMRILMLLGVDFFTKKLRHSCLRGP